MRWIFLLGLVVPALIVAGCTSPSSPVTPAPTASVVILTTQPTLQTTAPVIADGQMQINVTTWQSGNDVNIQYNGGASAAYLTSLTITINNQNGQVVTRTMDSPTPGDVYTFPYIGTPDADNVDVIGVFTGGVQQTVLLTNV
ncbi:MAG: hypothetical protein WC362_05660 [Methanoregula sp.]